MTPHGRPLRAVVLAALATFAVGGGMYLALAGIAAAAVVAPRWELRGAWSVVANLLAIVLSAVVGWITDVVGGFAVLASWLLVVQFHARGADAARTTLLVATLLLLLGCVRADNPALGVFFGVYAVALPLALIRTLPWPEEDPAAPAANSTAPARPGRRLDVVLGTLGGLGTLVLFVTLPRMQGGLFGADPVATSRFPSEMTLGAPRLTSDDLAEVLRVRVTTPEGAPIDGPVYVRARVLETFDGRRWSTRTPAGLLPRLPTNVRAEIETGAEPGAQLYGVGEILRIEGAPGVHREADGVFLHRAPGQPLSYVAWGHVAPLAAVHPDPEGRWTALPPDLDPRVTALAWSVEGSAGPEVAVAALRDHLLRTTTYTRTPATPVGDPTAWFLFTSNAGNCEHVASALAVLLRARGIPARVATGFYSEEVDESGATIVRRGHGHAWTEVLTLDGWTTVDATPPSALPAPQKAGLRARLATMTGAWYRRVVDYDMEAQFAAYGLVGKPLVGGGDGGSAPFRAGVVGMVAVVVLMTLGLGVARLVLMWLSRRRTRPLDASGVALARARKVAAAAGWAIPAELPPLEAAAWLRGPAGNDVADALARLGEQAYAARYGGTADGTALSRDLAVFEAAVRRRTSAARK